MICDQTTMSSVEYLREFVNERLTAAAEEIFSVFETTIVQYEQEIDRQRKLLDIVWNPEVKLKRIEIPQQHVCEEEEVHAEQQLSNKDCKSSLIEKDPEPQWIKEEQEELFTSQEGEQVALNQETHSFLVTPTHEESDDCETEPESNHQPLSHSSHVTETQDGIGGKHQDSGSKGDAESKSKQRGIDNNKVKNPEQVKISLETCTGERPFKCGTCGETFKKKGSLRRHWRVHTEIPQQHVCKQEEVHAEQQLSNKDCNSSVIQKDPEPPQIKEEQEEREELLFSREAEEHEIYTSMWTSRTQYDDQREPGQKSDHRPPSHTSDVAKSLAQEGNKYGNFKSTRHAELKPKKRHRKNKCRSDRVYSHKLSEIHLNTDPGNTSLRCDKAFECESESQSQLKILTGEKSYLCEICGKGFDDDSLLRKHARIHSLERPFLCTLCGKRFHFKSGLAVHTRLHTGERPFLCNTCGKRFNYNQLLQYHLRTHTGEKPYPCPTCGKAFRGKAILKQHMKIHRG